MKESIKTKKELIFAALLGLVIVFLNLLPTLLAYINTPEGFWFTGVNTYFDPTDINSYFTKMRNGYEGEWFWVNRYTTENFPKTPLFTFYAFLGHLARVLNISIPLAYYGAGSILGLLFFVILYHFICFFLPKEPSGYRLLALIIVGFGGGMGGFFLGRPFHFPDISHTDATFFSTLNFPHMVLNQILFLLILLFGYQSIQEKNSRKSLMVGVFSLLLSLVHPYTLFVTLVILSVDLLYCSGAIHHALNRRCHPRTGTSFGTGHANWYHYNEIFVASRYLVPLAFVLFITFFYYQRAILNDPLVRAWLARQDHTSPPVYTYLLGYGALSLFGLVGISSLAKRVGERGKFLILWVVSQFSLLYLPVPFQRLMIKGLFIGLGIVAVYGIKGLRNFFPRGVIFLLIFPIFVTNTGLLIRRQLINFPENRFFYITLEEKEALEYLNTNTGKNDIVLATLLWGNKIPAHTEARVYLGHRFETVNSRKKEKEVEDFFKGTLDVGRFLAEKEINYVHCGVEEQGLGDVCYKELAIFERVFENEEVIIYKIL